MPWPPLQERLFNLLEPGFLLYHSALAFITTAFQFYILQCNLPSTSNFKNVRDDAFSKFWTKNTQPVDPPAPPTGSATLVPPLLSRARGVVLDIGPGSGSYVSLFADNANISAVYGAEPTPGLHRPLQQRVNEAKLSGKYHILNSSADKAELLAALAKEGVKPSPQGLFDTIVCVRVLCSVPNLERAAEELYSLLRPGGELMIVEHIRNPWTKNGSVLGRLMQRLYHLLGWQFFLAGCNMDRDTPAIVRKAGAWEAVDVKTYYEWTALPYAAGTFTKKR
ncbi:hypothetical protein AYL99_11191 [Fonsecaea erecta]|uniref:Methyltransferase type 11 domain-containing protein n=1 Tax=Fonsecaea erecta TaxID=1367422 RepID=A0A178Z6D8_9EURO|nr:hypothetical protein AYL99_11191 [Fonsecaea erecta]OAP54743.1 hypothetical protein AYL99_11191 [Fonsecaea erecta]